MLLGPIKKCLSVGSGRTQPGGWRHFIKEDQLTNVRPIFGILTDEVEPLESTNGKITLGLVFVVALFTVSAQESGNVALKLNTFFLFQRYCLQP